jgi:hypothetical protein
MRPGKSAGKKGDAGMRAIGVRLRDGVGSSGGGLAAGAAVPDTNGLTLHSVLTAELAHIAGVLCDLEAIVSGLSESVLRGTCSWASTHFHLLDLLTERGTVTGTILSGDSDLLGACVSGSILRSGGQRGVGRRTFRHFGGVVGVTDGGAKFEGRSISSCGRQSLAATWRRLLLLAMRGPDQPAPTADAAPTRPALRSSACARRRGGAQLWRSAFTA